MRIVFHVGMGKTGTSSLQGTLAKNRGALAEHGIAYPNIGGGPSHGWLQTVVKPFRSRARGFDDLAPEDWAAASENVAAALLRAAEARPRVMIISTEYAFDFTAKGHAKVARLMRSLSDDIRVVAWLREPIGYYRSYIHQRAKPVGGPHRDRSPPSPESFSPRLRDRVGRLWDVWGKERVALHLYDRCAMVEGDSVSDFLARAVPEAQGIPLKPVRTNVDKAPELDAATRTVLQKSCADDVAFMQEMGLLPCLNAARTDENSEVRG